jgi:hypothetical protein
MLGLLRTCGASCCTEKWKDSKTDPDYMPRLRSYNLFCSHATDLLRFRESVLTKSIIGGEGHTRCLPGYDAVCSSGGWLLRSRYVA